MRQKFDFRIYTEVMKEVDGKYYFPLLCQNGICRYDFQTNHCEFLTQFPHWIEKGGALYGRMAVAEEKIIFCPQNTLNICSYNILSNCAEEIVPAALLDNEYKVSKNGFFLDAFIWKDNAFFVPFNYQAIVKVNLATKEVSYIRDWIDEIDHRVEQGHFHGYFGRSIQSDNIIVMPCTSADAIMLFDMDTMEHNMVPLHSGIHGFWCVAQDDEYYWLSPYECEEGVRYRIQGGASLRIHMPAKIQYPGAPFHEATIVGDWVFFMPARGNHVWRVNRLTGEAVIAQDFEWIFHVDYEGFSRGWYATFSPGVYENKLFFITGKNGTWHFYDALTGQFDDFNVYIDDQIGLKLLGEMLSGDKQPLFWGENIQFDLMDYLHFLPSYRGKYYGE